MSNTITTKSYINDKQAQAESYYLFSVYQAERKAKRLLMDNYPTFDLLEENTAFTDITEKELQGTLVKQKARKYCGIKFLDNVSEITFRDNGEYSKKKANKPFTASAIIDKPKPTGYTIESEILGNYGEYIGLSDDDKIWLYACNDMIYRDKAEERQAEQGTPDDTNFIYQDRDLANRNARKDRGQSKRKASLKKSNAKLSEKRITSSAIKALEQLTNIENGLKNGSISAPDSKSYIAQVERKLTPAIKAKMETLKAVQA